MVHLPVIRIAEEEGMEGEAHLVGILIDLCVLVLVLVLVPLFGGEEVPIY